jgi:hypothetical protein
MNPGRYRASGMSVKWNCDKNGEARYDIAISIIM